MKPKKRARAKARPRQRRETSAGGIVTRVENGRRLYLLICDKHGNWGFPKGHIERGEDALAAALREVEEETGVNALTVHGEVSEIAWTFKWRGTLIKKNCHYFLMETSTARTEPQTDEGITECRWSELSGALELLRYDNARQVLRDADALAADVAMGSST